MKHLNTCVSAHLLCALMICLCAFVYMPAPATAGEFGATFNSRLTCEYSSWHEGKVVSVNKDYIAVALVRDLLRHAPKKTVRIAKHGGKENALRKGDFVLINCWTKPKKIDWTKFPNSFTFTPHFMGKIDRARKEVGASMGGGYPSRMLTWFYRTGRWDARVTTSKTKKPSHYAWYAVLPNGKKYLIYDETDPKRPAQYIVR